MKRAFLSILLSLYILFPAKATYSYDLQKLSDHFSAKFVTVSAIYEDASDTNKMISGHIPVAETGKNLLFLFLLREIMVIYNYSQNALLWYGTEPLPGVEGPLLYEAQIDECKETLCKDAMFYHGHLAHTAVLTTQLHLQDAKERLIFLTSGIENPRLTQLLNDTIETVKETIELIGPLSILNEMQPQGKRKETSK